MFWKQPKSQKTSPLQKHAAVVEQNLASIGIDPSRARMNSDSGYGWSIQISSALIEIYLAEQEERVYLQVLSPLIHIPPSSIGPLFRRLLELNLSIPNASFGIYLDVIYIFNERPLDSLDTDMMKFNITHIATYANNLDHQLVNEFGGRIYGTT
mgnify:CR=1 FL=1